MIRRIADSTFGTAGDDNELCAVMQPVAGERILVAFQAEPGEILIREFYDIRHGGHASDTGEMSRLVLDKAGADVRIERDDALFMLAQHQRLVGRAAGFGDQADCAEMQRLAFVSDCR
ncbi:hypothetical protein D3C87_1765870 [compost metagenome]